VLCELSKRKEREAREVIERGESARVKEIRRGARKIQLALGSESDAGTGTMYFAIGWDAGTLVKYEYSERGAGERNNHGEV
jgi:hypothetical protein